MLTVGRCIEVKNCRAKLMMKIVDDVDGRLPLRRRWSRWRIVVGLSLFDELRYSFPPPPTVPPSTSIPAVADMLAVDDGSGCWNWCLVVASYRQMSYRQFPSLSPTGRFWTLLNLDFALSFRFTARMDNFGCRLPAWIFTGRKLAVCFLSSSDEKMCSLLSLFEY